MSRSGISPHLITRKTSYLDKWTIEEEEELMNAVKEHSPLRVVYSSTHKKNESWKKVSEKLNVPVSICKHNWLRLRAIFISCQKQTTSNNIRLKYNRLAQVFFENFIILKKDRKSGKVNTKVIEKISSLPQFIKIAPKDTYHSNTTINDISIFNGLEERGVKTVAKSNDIAKVSECMIRRIEPIDVAKVKKTVCASTQTMYERTDNVLPHNLVQALSNTKEQTLNQSTEAHLAPHNDFATNDVAQNNKCNIKHALPIASQIFSLVNSGNENASNISSNEIDISQSTDISMKTQINFNVKPNVTLYDISYNHQSLSTISENVEKVLGISNNEECTDEDVVMKGEPNDKTDFSGAIVIPKPTSKSFIPEGNVVQKEACLYDDVNNVANNSKIFSNHTKKKSARDKITFEEEVEMDYDCKAVVGTTPKQDSEDDSSKLSSILPSISDIDCDEPDMKIFFNNLCEYVTQRFSKEKRANIRLKMCELLKNEVIEVKSEPIDDENVKQNTE